jgi:hypothetical protein
VHAVGGVTHTEIHAASPLVPELSSFESEFVTEELRIYKSPGTDQIPAKLIQA